MATDDDGSCTFAEDLYDCDGNCLNDEDMDGVCDELEVAGCPSPYACHYDELATDDDGSCTVVGDACDDGHDTTEADRIDEHCEGEGTETVARVGEAAATTGAVHHPAPHRWMATQPAPQPAARSSSPSRCRTALSSDAATWLTPHARSPTSPMAVMPRPPKVDGQP